MLIAGQKLKDCPLRQAGVCEGDAVTTVADVRVFEGDVGRLSHADGGAPGA